MDEETKRAWGSASQEHRERRFNELRERLGLANPQSIAGGDRPPEGSDEDLEEYEFLKKLLGYG
jgi:hypothetical protein